MRTRSKKMTGLFELIQNDGFILTRQATTGGGEWSSPCPWCGGRDRFRVWPNQSGGRYWCRLCEKSGDTVQYLRERRGLSFGEACTVLGRDPGLQLNKARPEQAVWEPRIATAPPDLWQKKARAFLDRAVAYLWSARGNKLRAWLHDAKGLSDASIKMAWLGLHLGLFEARQFWGLAPAFREDGRARRQWVPPGLVIPFINGAAVHRLRVRRMDLDAQQRYAIVSGSSSAPMAWGQKKGVVVIVESELDGLLLNQEAGDLAMVISMGSAQARPDQDTHEALTAAEIILVATDADDAGAKAAWGFWLPTYKTAKRWPCIQGKDPSAARLNGLDLRAWVVAGITKSKSAGRGTAV